MMLLTILSSVFIATYFLFFILLRYGWKRHAAVQIHEPGDPVSVAVIIPIRNEKESIDFLLTDLLQQSYPREQTRIYLVDDGSTDGTTEILKRYAAAHDGYIWYVSVSDRYKNWKGKKKAIASAIDQSDETLILTTDADCRIGREWIRTFVAAFQQTDAMFVSGPVKMTGGKGFRNRFQEVEFASLIGSGASAIGLGYPLMCNGACLGYTRKAYNAVGGFNGNEEIASGDDEFLMHKIATSFKKKVVFLKHSEAIAQTATTHSIHTFVQQRKRWAGKWEHYSLLYVQALALWVFIYHLSLILGLAAMLSGFGNIYLVAAMWLMKALCDYFYLKSVTSFLSIAFKIDIFIGSVLIYPFYVVLFGILSRFGSYEWKGRTEPV